MEKFVKEVSSATGCTEGLITALVDYFSERKSKNLTDIVNGASNKFNISPIVVANVFRFWQAKGVA